MTKINFYVPGEYEEAKCPICGHEFDQYEWEMLDSIGDEWGGQTEYECSQKNCDGMVVLFD